jgi:putative lipoic acid-binding regulatory protein
MGVNQPQLLNEVVAIIDSLCESFNANQDIKSKLSSKENYLAITATVLAQSKQHLDSVYLALNQHPLVKVTL